MMSFALYTLEVVPGGRAALARCTQSHPEKQGRQGYTGAIWRAETASQARTPGMQCAAWGASWWQK